VSDWTILIVAACATLIACGFLWNAERARQQNERLLRDARDAEARTLHTLNLFIQHQRKGGAA